MHVVMALVLVTALMAPEPHPAVAANNPEIWSFVPDAGSVAGPGSMILVDFTRPMEPTSVLVQIDPPTKFWW